MFQIVDLSVDVSGITGIILFYLYSAIVDIVTIISWNTLVKLAG